jgi:2-oxoacid:acceptor oxidoreductase gamma subunit (pyruvate/2-ketoisovalerate family)
MLEIKFSGRGGQGVVVASQILGLAFFKAGKYPQCYSVFGGEQRGAPLVSFLRVDEEKILLKCEIRRPQELICLDDELVDPNEVKTLLVPGGRILINTRRPPESFEALNEFKLGFIDALEISEGAGLGRIFNTAIVGAYARFAGHPELDYIMDAVAELVPAKKEANLEASRRAYDAVKIYN